MKRKIIVSTLALTLGLTGWMVVRRGRAAVVQVEAGEIHETIIAQGQVVATAGDADVRALVDGRVVEVAVREGDSVTAGQLLAKIDTQEIDAAIARAEAQEEVAKAELAVAQAGGRVEEKHAAQAALDEAQANLALEESRATRDTALADQGAIPSATADDSRRTAAIAKAKVARAMAERNSTLRGREEAIEAARARVAEADAELTAARARRERAIVVAPIDGVVLARHVDAGDGVTPGAVMFELADAGATELRVEIEESDALRVTVGLDVDVTTSGGHDVIGHGTVARISPRLATRTIGANEARMRAETQVRSVWIRWTDKSALPIGMRVEARVKLPAKKVAARVPRSSVLVRDGQATVEVPRYWITADTREVELGAADDGFVEIRGMSAGAKVAVAP